jgi:hypothetical protein
MEIGNPDTHVSQSLTLFTHPSHCELRKVFCTIVLSALGPSGFQISSIQDVAHCTMALIDERLYGFDIHASWACKRRRKVEGRTTRKEASIADNLST